MSNAKRRRTILDKLEAVWEQYPEKTLASIVYQTEAHALGIQWAPDDQWIKAIQHEFPDRGHVEERESGK